MKTFFKVIGGIVLLVLFFPFAFAYYLMKDKSK